MLGAKIRIIDILLILMTLLSGFGILQILSGCSSSQDANEKVITQNEGPVNMQATAVNSLDIQESQVIEKVNNVQDNLIK